MNLPSGSKVTSGGHSHFGMIEVTFNVITTIQKFIQIHQSVQKLHHLRSLNIRHFGVMDVTFSVITSIHFNQFNQLV
jgi:hypothetical protein